MEIKISGAIMRNSNDQNITITNPTIRMRQINDNEFRYTGRSVVTVENGTTEGRLKIRTRITNNTEVRIDDIREEMKEAMRSFFTKADRYWQNQ